MSLFDDLFDLGSDSSSIDLGSVIADAAPSISGAVTSTTEPFDWSSLFGDNTELAYPDSSTIDTGSLLDTAANSVPQSSAVDDYLKALGMDSTPAAFDLTSASVENPVANSQIWNTLNTTQDPIYSAATDSNMSTPALLSALTDRSAGYSGTGSDMFNQYYDDGSVMPTAPLTYSGPGSDSFNEYYDPKTGVVPTNAGIPTSLITKLLSASGQGKKSNLASGIGALSMASQALGALAAKDKNAPAPAQHGTTSMSWNKSAANKGKKLASGGDVGMPNIAGKPQGALGLLRGRTMGQADQVPINAAHGEYVMDADTVSALGDGNTDAGAVRLDKMRENIRAHKRSAPPTKIPPKAKEPIAYLKGAK